MSSWLFCLIIRILADSQGDLLKIVVLHGSSHVSRIFVPRSEFPDAAGGVRSPTLTYDAIFRLLRLVPGRFPKMEVPQAIQVIAYYKRENQWLPTF